MQVSVKNYQALVLLAAGRERNISDQLTLFLFSFTRDKVALARSLARSRENDGQFLWITPPLR